MRRTGRRARRAGGRTEEDREASKESRRGEAARPPTAQDNDSGARGPGERSGRDQSGGINPTTKKAVREKEMER